MAVRPIHLTFFDHTAVEDCDARCNMAWAPKSAMDMIRAQLEQDFDGEVIVEYIDVAQPANQLLYGDLARRVETENLATPIITIDGVPKLSGNVEYRTIVEAIETYREVSRGRSV